MPVENAGVHREAIRHLVTQFTIHSDRARFEEATACFADDAIAHWINRTARGRAEIARSMQVDTDTRDKAFSRHNLTTMQILIDDEGLTASGRIYFMTLTNAGLDHGGVYVDRYVRVDGEWLIAEREVRIDWQSPNSVYNPSVTR